MMVAEVDVVTSKGMKAYYAFKGSRSGQVHSVESDACKAQYATLLSSIPICSMSMSIHICFSS
jgi:hypothetical protein